MAPAKAPNKQVCVLLKKVTKVYTKDVKQFLIFFVVFIGFIGMLVFVFWGKIYPTQQNKKAHQTETTNSPDLSPAISQASDQGQNPTCQVKQFTATISPQGAAGNTFADLQLTNNGSVACTIKLGNEITVKSGATNLTLNNKQQVNEEDFSLAPGASVYSQVHYPNGAQCQNGVTPTDIGFFYQKGIAFVTADQKPLLIQTCTSDTEKTTVDIWPISKNPITK